MGGKQHREPLYGRWRCCSGGGRSTLNWNTPSRAQPYPSRWGEKNQNGWVIRHLRCTSDLFNEPYVLSRLSATQCDASDLSIWNRGKWMLRNTLHLAHFFFEFFFTQWCTSYIPAWGHASLQRGRGTIWEWGPVSYPQRWMTHKTPIPPPYTHQIEDEPSSGGQTTKHHGTNKWHCTNVKMFI